MKMHNLLATVAIIISQMTLFSYGHWPSGNSNPYDMRRNMFYHNNPGYAPQNYHYQQMNGNQLVNHQSPAPCNCIKLKFCNPVMEMARNMYSGFIADYINSQLQVIACNHIDGQMAVCCPKSNHQQLSESREKRGYGWGKHGHYPEHGHHSEHGHHHGHEKKWVWDSSEIGSSEEVTHSRQPPKTYPMNQYTSYPIQGFFPFSNVNLKPEEKFVANHEDPNSNKNCPPPFSPEFSLPNNHTFFIEPAEITTPIPRLEILTTPPSENQAPDMQAKMSLINDDSCGRSLGSRITGGEDAGIGRFSWMGRLAYRNKTSSRISYRCAGSLVSDRYLITAGHCVSNLVDSLELALVRLGEVDANQQNECNESGVCMEEQDFEIENTIVHPSYNKPRYANDIALVRLKQSTATSNSIGPICLPIGLYQEAPNLFTAGTNGIVAGWGAQNRISEAQSQMLQWIRLPFVENSECASFYANYTSNFRSRIMISNSQLCVQGRENGDACAGDSGGPLMNEAGLGNDKFILLGLVSFGPRSCGLSNFPGVYTRISSYMEWLLKNIEP